MKLEIDWNFKYDDKYKIEGMTTEEVEEWIYASDDEFLISLRERNQVSYITKFFSDPLMAKNGMPTGMYIKGTNLYDLLILYYLDYVLKQKIYQWPMDIERMFNVVILNTWKDNELFGEKDKTTDKDNSFGKKLGWYKKLPKDKKQLIFERYVNVHKVNIKSVKEFIEALEAAVGLRNFILHHYSIVSAHYAYLIKNGEAHVEKDGIDTTLDAELRKSMVLVPGTKPKKLANAIFKHISKYKFSTEEISKNILDFYREKLILKELLEYKGHEVPKPLSFTSNFVKTNDEEKEKIIEYLSQ